MSNSLKAQEDLLASPGIEEELRHFYKLAWPIILASITHVMFGVTDTLMIGNLSTADLAACAFGSSLFFFVAILGFGIANATSPLVARAIGSHNQTLAAMVLKHSLLISVIIGFILSIILAAMAFFIEEFGQTTEVAIKAKPFIIILAVSIIPSLLFQVYRQYLEAQEKPKLPMFYSVAALLLNVLLNYAMIYGKLGLPQLGLVGAGVATLISRSFLALAMIYEVHFRGQFLKNEMATPWRTGVFKEILGLGVPSGFILLFEVGAFSFSSIMAGWINKESLAAHQVVLSFGSITFMVPLGLSFAASIRVGNGYGRKNIQAMKTSIKAAFIFAVVFMSLTTISFILLRNYLALPFSSDEKVLAIAPMLFLTAGFFQLFDGIQVTSMGILRALADMKVPFIITFSSYWLLALPFSYWITFKKGFGAQGIWYGLLVGLSIASIFLLIRILRIVDKLELNWQKS